LLLLAAVHASPPPGPWTHSIVGTATLEQVHVLVAGPEDGIPVVLLHGFPDSSHGWRNVLPLLAEDHRVYAPDLRGYGGTSAPDDGYDLPTLAGDLVALLDALALDSVHLIGHDWGAIISWEAGGLYPERFETITVLSVPHLGALKQTWDEDPAQRRYKRFANLMTWRITPRIFAGLDAEDRAAEVYHPELVDNTALSDADADHYHALFDTREETLPPLRYYRENFGDWREVWDKAASAPRIQVPVLALWGGQDTYMLPVNAERSCDFVDARCAWAVHPDAAHWVLWEQADWLVDEWRRFTASDEEPPR